MNQWSSTQFNAGCNQDWQERLTNSLEQIQWSESITPIANKIASGERLSIDEGLILFQHHDLNEVGRLADYVRKSRFDNFAFFNSNVHVNQTNVCVLSCRFCAFRRSKRALDAYSLDIEAYVDDLSKYADYVDEVHSVGGLHPEWDVHHYQQLFRTVRDKFPHITIKALTAVEIKHLSHLSNMSFREVLTILKDAGLGSLPGGGAEILDDEIRAIICNGKESSEEYLEIHKTAHEIGLPSNCTMLFGTVETIQHRLIHMDKLRKLADITGGFQCFVPYPFLPDSSRLPEAQCATGSEVLRTIAISRLMLDSIPHIKAYRMNIGDGLSELALQFGADDIDGTVQKESIMHLAGSTAPLDHDLSRLSKLIENAGCIPVKRNTTYQQFEIFVATKPKPRRGLKMAQR